MTLLKTPLVEDTKTNLTQHTKLARLALCAQVLPKVLLINTLGRLIELFQSSNPIALQANLPAILTNSIFQKLFQLPRQQIQFTIQLKLPILNQTLGLLT